MKSEWLHVCAPCSYPNTEPATLLQASCNRLGVKLHLFGMGTSWINFINVKLEPLREHLKTVNEVYVLVMDCTDTLLLRGEDAILEAVSSYGDTIVCASNRVLYPWELKHEDYPELKTPYRYLNAGIIGGPHGMVQDAVERIFAREPVNGWCDQAEWAREYTEGHCVVDQYCRLAQNMSDGGADDVVVDGTQLYNTVTSTYPCVVHFGGHVGGREALWKTLNS